MKKGFKVSLQELSSTIKLPRTQLNVFNFLIFITPIIIFGYTLYVYYPGCLTFDSYNQLTQITSGSFSPGHPLFHTLLEVLLLKIFNSPATIAAFQILCFSFIWFLICKYNNKSVKGVGFKILQVLLVIVICINPINSIHSITLWKDILYSYMILLLSFFFQVMADKKFILKNSEILALSLLLVVIPNLRHNGLIVLIVSTAVLVLLLFILDRKSKNWIKLLITTILFFNLFQIPNKLLIEDTNNLFGVFTYKTLHLTSAYLHEELFTEEEQKYLGTIIDLDEVFNGYNPYFLDPMGTPFYRRESYPENETKLRMLLLEKSIENPKSFFRYLGKSTVVIWKLRLSPDTIGTILTLGHDGTDGVKEIRKIHTEETFFAKYNEYINLTLTNKYTGLIFYSAGFYLYLSIGLMTLLLLWKRVNKYYLLILLPNLLNMVGLAISIPVQDTRYVYSSFLVGYLVILLFLKEIYLKCSTKVGK